MFGIISGSVECEVDRLEVRSGAGRAGTALLDCEAWSESVRENTLVTLVQHRV